MDRLQYAPEPDDYNPFQVWCDNATIDELQAAADSITDAEERSMISMTLLQRRHNRENQFLSNN